MSSLRRFLSQLILLPLGLVARLGLFAVSAAGMGLILLGILSFAVHLLGWAIGKSGVMHLWWGAGCLLGSVAGVVLISVSAQIHVWIFNRKSRGSAHQPALPMPQAPVPQMQVRIRFPGQEGGPAYIETCSVTEVPGQAPVVERRVVALPTQQGPVELSF